MHLYILHYHLNRGGVTRVIENHLRGLAALPATEHPHQATIIYGGRNQGWSHETTASLPFPCNEVVMEELDYDEDADRSRQLIDQLIGFFEQRVEHKSRTLIHVHNHQLGKNLELPNALRRLAEDGWRVLLQIHDFSEELRPANYSRMLAHAGSANRLHQSLYPMAQHVHYATLNQGHLQLLRKAGVSHDQLHLLPNPVVRTGKEPARNPQATRETVRETIGVPRDHGFVLYPVRGIRRKNLGELLLWSMMVPQATFGLTLAPLNPKERLSYDQWSRFANELNLAVAFDIGSRVTLEDNYTACDAVITTSIAEGFGMVFLESYLFERELFGRDLPAVTDDFRSHGITFPHLVPTIRVPNQLIDHHALVESYTQLLAESREAYGDATESISSLRMKLEEELLSEQLDFAKLDTRHQRKVLQELATNQELKRNIRRLNPCFEQLESALRSLGNKPQRHALRPSHESVRRIQDSYAIDVVGTTYRQICQQLLESPLSAVRFDASIGNSVLQQFLDLKMCMATRLESPLA